MIGEKPAFGRAIPKTERKGALCYWGARTIFHPRQPNVFEILADRITVECIDSFPVESRVSPESKLSRALKTWAEGTAFKKIKAAMKLAGPDESEEYRLDDGRFHAVASPQASYGYLYLGLWETKE